MNQSLLESQRRCKDLGDDLGKSQTRCEELVFAVKIKDEELEVLRRVADSRQHEIRELSAELSEVKDTLVGTRRARTNILQESWKSWRVVIQTRKLPSIGGFMGVG